ncbi:oligomeric Golgi complex subunit, putative [Candida dubliniensis CD36]|uniref:Conserved oligomeric Golgi complex subunit 5 n=1 Tax=Candida dubliniensis (strain CD36 / ATCC MYA-646 / CBS 7987 / NCPF 3949 / NRRL Y-17841) TaxID=573826 RepID=B9W8P9_CANDC|nr:oligomeric Golgi complex subunit, putative [Candida dubliniensis CD36]CAX45122.1 oligomeric Golgi complex subunit, putative [Candida dubliniensis CD36]
MTSQNTEYQSNELEDFEAFLETNFEPQQFANELLLATNGQENPHLDLVTPIKKLKFDIQECDKRIEKISSSNYSSLISNFQKITEYQKILTSQVNPSLERINVPFKRIKQEVVEPFDEAMKLNKALKRIHLTLELLRTTSFFVFIIQQIEELTSVSNERDLVRLAKLHIQINKMYQDATNEKGAEINVLSVKLIRDYQSIAISKKSSMLSQCIDVVSGDFRHPSTLERKNSKLHSHLSALYLLNRDEFFNVFDRSTITRKVQSASAQLSRALQSPRNFTAIITEVKEESSEYFTKLSDILSDWKSENDDDKGTFLEIVLNYYKSQSLTELFWSKLNQKFKKSIVAAMARGGPIAKNLKIYYSGLKASVSETFKSEEERSMLLDSLSMIEYK